MIITVTTNPAMDKVLILHDFRLNVTNRIVRMFNCIGGKGTHISVNLSLLGIGNIAVGAVYGKIGSDIINRLEEYENIDVQFLYRKNGESRTNYVLVDKHNCTIIAQKGKPMRSEAAAYFLEKLEALVKAGDTVIFSGDLSNCESEDFQDRLIDIAVEKGGKIFLDCSGDALKNGVKKKPFLIKPNVDELSYFCGRALSAEQEIMEGMKVMSEQGVRNIVVSRGSEGCLALCDGKYYRVTVPDVEIKNTVGCGDALVSGLLAGFEQNLDIAANLKRANAIATASAMNEMTAGFDVNLIDGLSSQVTVECV